MNKKDSQPEGKIYIPPHLRNRPINESTNSDRDRNGNNYRQQSYGNSGPAGGYGGNRLQSSRQNGFGKSDNWNRNSSNKNDRRGSYQSRNNSNTGNFGKQPEDWSVMLSRDEQLEDKLFGGGNTGINFDKYEDIPVEATGDDVPKSINTVCFRHFLNSNFGDTFFENSKFFKVF